MSKKSNVRMPSRNQIARVILKGLGDNPDRLVSNTGNPIKDASRKQIKAWMKKNLR